MELGRVIVLVKGEKFALIRVNWTTKTFVAGDVLSFMMQASGMFSPRTPFPSYVLIVYRSRDHGHRSEWLWRR